MSGGALGIAAIDCPMPAFAPHPPLVFDDSGTPTSTTRPSGTEGCSRITATSTNETIAPANRAETSMTWPRWDRSLVPIATTSPVVTLRGRVPPRCVVCRPTSCTVR